MFLVGLLSWWYSGGIKRRFAKIGSRITGTVDFFSIGLLISTLFAPYKQISAGNLSGSFTFADQVRAFLDRSISRIIGAFARSFMIIIGIFVITMQFIFEILATIIWLTMPALPVIGAVIMLTGWLPL